jgi:cell division protein FtsW
MNVLTSPIKMSRLEATAERETAGAGILVIAACLMGLGLLMVGSSHASLDRALFDTGMWRTAFGRQLIFVLVGLVAMWVVSRIGVILLASEIWTRRVVVASFLFAVIALLVAFVPGLADLEGGRHRWLRMSVGGIDVGFQPSEWAKLATPAMLALLFTRPGADVASFLRGFLPAALVLGGIVGLVGTEDFGTSALVAASGGLLLLMAGCRILHLLLVAALGSIGMVGLLVLAPYRLERIFAYQHLWETGQAGGYQPLQSLITIASGGWWGRGLGAGVQKYGYLPESHTDFIYAVICEELGVAGAMLVILLFCVMLWFGIRAMQRAVTPIERLLAFGITAMLGVQAALNIAVVTVLTPTTGISLPLISAGGSGILTYAIALGLLAAIERRAVAAETAPLRSGGDERVCLPSTEAVPC